MVFFQHQQADNTATLFGSSMAEENSQMSSIKPVLFRVADGDSEAAALRDTFARERSHIERIMRDSNWLDEVLKSIYS
jgi:hypothetical protein